MGKASKRVQKHKSEQSLKRKAGAGSQASGLDLLSDELKQQYERYGWLVQTSCSVALGVVVGASLLTMMRAAWRLQFGHGLGATDHCQAQPAEPWQEQQQGNLPRPTVCLAQLPVCQLLPVRWGGLLRLAGRTVAGPLERPRALAHV